MRKLILAVIILIGFSCAKDTTEESKETEYITQCGTILGTPVLDSFVYPTYYLTTIVAFADGDEVVHFHDKVTGDHDGSWFLTKYDKDSTYCRDTIH